MFIQYKYDMTSDIHTIAIQVLFSIFMELNVYEITMFMIFSGLGIHSVEKHQNGTTTTVN